MSAAAALLLALTPSPLTVAPTRASSMEGDAEEFGRLTLIPAAEGRRVLELLSCDVDGDDMADLLVATTDGSTRTLALYPRRTKGKLAFLGLPSASIELTPDVLAFAAADVHPDAGREVLLLNQSGVFTWRWRSEEKSDSITKLFAVDFLWQRSSPTEIFHWEAGVRDLDGNGFEDLVLPEPEGAVVAFQHESTPSGRGFASGAFAHVRRAEVDPDARTSLDFGRKDSSGKRSFEFGSSGLAMGRGGDQAPWMRLDERAPSLHLCDWDGDGDTDVVYATATTIEGWRQEPRGSLETRRFQVENPVTVDRGRSLDISYSSHALDVSGDGALDVIVFAGDRRSKDARTQVLVHLHKRIKDANGVERDVLGDPAGAPDQLLVLDGFARALRIQDVDGDGRPDLVIGAVRPDLLEKLKNQASERLDVEVYVYRNLGGAFSKRPDMSRKVSVAAGGFRYEFDFLGDVTGDGIHDLFQRVDPERITLQRVVLAKGGGLSVTDKPLWEVSIGEAARLVLPGKLSLKSPDVFVIEGGTIQCYTFL